MKANDLYGKLYAAAVKDTGRKFYSLTDKVGSWNNIINAISKLPEKKLREQVDVEAMREQLFGGVVTPRWYHAALIPKKNNQDEKRMIFLSFDPNEMARQNAIKQVIEPIFEASFQECSYAYRHEKGVLKGLQDFKAYADSGHNWVVKLDVKKFFDSIKHKKLTNIIQSRIADGTLLKLINEVICTGYTLDGKYVKPDIGILQGMVLAPLLSNIYLNELDKKWYEAGYENCRMFRYSDDILIVGNSQDTVVKALDMVEEELRKLALTYKVTELINLSEGAVEILGFVNTMVQGNLSQVPTSQALQYIEAEIREEIQSGGDKLEQKIAGWMNYYRINTDADVLVKSVICKTTGKWR